MTRRAAATALAVAGVLVPAVPASAARGPAAVVRAWSVAVNRSDNEAAARLFAKNAVVVQNGLRLVLSTHHLAVLWNEGLPCSGRIVKLTVSKDVADTTFVLGERKGLRCDAPGQKARAAFQVRSGKIVYWVQLPVPASKKKPDPLNA